MEPNQGRGCLGQIAQDYGNRLLLLITDAESKDPSRAESGRQIGLGQPIDELFAAPAMTNELLDGDDLQLVLFRQRVELLAWGSIAVGVEDFAQDARRLQSRHADHVDGRLGMPGPAQHAAFLGHQRE